MILRLVKILIITEEIGEFAAYIIKKLINSIFIFKNFNVFFIKVFLLIFKLVFTFISHYQRLFISKHILCPAIFSILSFHIL